MTDKSDVSFIVAERQKDRKLVLLVRKCGHSPSGNGGKKQPLFEEVLLGIDET
jgi:hypothetical protein